MEQELKYYETQEIAEILHVNKRMINIYIKQGKLKAYKLGKKNLIKKEDLDTFLAENLKER